MQMPDDIEVEFEGAVKVVMQWDVTMTGEQMIFNHHRDKIDEYLRAVDEILHWIEPAAMPDDLSEEDKDKIELIIVARLEHEFVNILAGKTNPRYSSCSSFSSCQSDESLEEEYVDLDTLSEEAIHNLRTIAEKMNTAKYLSRCIQAYKSVRKAVVNARFERLGVKQLSTGDVRWTEWEVMQSKIREWMRAAKICVHVLFMHEKQLSQEIFEGLGRTGTADTCFAETVRYSASQLLAFAAAISTIRPSPERLISISDTYQTISDLDYLFQSKEMEFIRFRADEILPRLAKMIRGILSAFEDALRNELTSIPPARGEIHQLTKYVMKFARAISMRKQTLIKLIVSEPPSPITLIDFKQGNEGQIPLGLHLIWIIDNLQLNLEGKSMQYKIASLSHLFMMNNIYYIVRKIEGSRELREILGDVYSRELVSRFRQAATSYQRETWVRVLHCLRYEGLHLHGSFSSGVPRSALKERFKTFNAMFEEIQRTQALWLVPDRQLRQELRISISEKVIPAYRAFSGHFRGHIEFGKHPEKYIKYSAEDLETAVLDLFK